MKIILRMYGRVCRLEKVMRPYLEAILSGSIRIVSCLDKVNKFSSIIEDTCR
jgi:hypothetical protein